MTVHFIGAGPGAADLITVRGQRLLAQCPVCLYAGSTVATELLDYCPPGARLINTAALDLEAIEQEYLRAHQHGEAVARLHSGDLSVYSALAEQLRRLRKHGIDYTLTPGVPAFAAAAALLERELTVPEVAQSVVLTRLSGRASKMPERERLETFAETGATLAIHLAIHRLEEITARLMPFYGAECPVAVVYRASWPEERMIQGTLGDIVTRLALAPIERSALILVGPALSNSGFRDSALYETGYCRRFRHEDRAGGPDTVA
ncbi:precorrin-4 C(11)-methyltransferase [Kushneria pakistanensis]|uniref:Precorrin-4 C(11)-methyltransferase n=1 Tax=Kushneria pakistanensis TaxID=1508770 RepID=A0ABQ3FJK9_9GAMM|nr:precorrin-4 C(11)-methyltransferase [Kushneria pakistanensis]GHC26438.1 precorrin-4 C(11)-methyltransferase [Kushneria pakistanensis]